MKKCDMDEKTAAKGLMVINVIFSKMSDTGLVRAVGITSANVAEATVTEALAIDERASESSVAGVTHRSSLLE